MLRLLMVTDVKLSLQNRSHDAMGGRFGLLARGLRSGDTNCAGPDKRHPNRKRRHDELLMLRGMIASTYRIITVLYRRQVRELFLAARVLRLE